MKAKDNKTEQTTTTPRWTLKPREEKKSSAPFGKGFPVKYSKPSFSPESRLADLAFVVILLITELPAVPSSEPSTSFARPFFGGDFNWRMIAGRGKCLGSEKGKNSLKMVWLIIQGKFVFFCVSFSSGVD